MLGVIGGTGFNHLPDVEIIDQVWVETPFGDTSGPIVSAVYQGKSIAFLARHGNPHKIPPHLINYRANLFALKKFGVDQLVAVNAVGGINKALGPGALAIPDQIIDYTSGREHTIYDGKYCETVDHIDFTSPYSEELRAKLLDAAKARSVPVLVDGVYGATQGPRLESAAEIRKYQRDGCDMVGMTGMPEASLARELGLKYACIAMSANWAAGLSQDLITMSDIRKSISIASSQVNVVLFSVIDSTA